MTVRALFHVVSVKHLPHDHADIDPVAEVELIVQPPAGASEGASDVTGWVPRGTVKLTVIGPEAVRQFELADAFKLTLEPAP